MVDEEYQLYKQDKLDDKEDIQYDGIKDYINNEEKKEDIKEVEKKDKHEDEKEEKKKVKKVILNQYILELNVIYECKKLKELITGDDYTAIIIYAKIVKKIMVESIIIHYLKPEILN